MPIASSGRVTLSNLKAEFGGSNQTVYLSQFYKNASNAYCAGNSTVPDSGNVITIGNFKGLSKCDYDYVYITPGTYTFVVPERMAYLNAVVIGGGGGGRSTLNGGGGGGGGGLSWVNRLPVTPGETLTVVVGAGAPGISDSNAASVAAGQSFVRNVGSNFVRALGGTQGTFMLSNAPGGTGGNTGTNITFATGSNSGGGAGGSGGMWINNEAGVVEDVVGISGMVGTVALRQSHPSREQPRGGEGEVGKMARMEEVAAVMACLVGAMDLGRPPLGLPTTSTILIPMRLVEDLGIPAV